MSRLLAVFPPSMRGLLRLLGFLFVLVNIKSLPLMWHVSFALHHDDPLLNFEIWDRLTDGSNNIGPLLSRPLPPSPAEPHIPPHPRTSLCTSLDHLPPLALRVRCQPTQIKQHVLFRPGHQPHAPCRPPHQAVTTAPPQARRAAHVCCARRGRCALSAGNQAI